jgi:hypothetical protein
MVSRYKGNDITSSCIFKQMAYCFHSYNVIKIFQASPNNATCHVLKLEQNHLGN